MGAVLNHVEFCLDEIECEIEEADEAVLASCLKSGLKGNIASMRAIIEAARASKPAAMVPKLPMAAAPRGLQEAEDFMRIRGVTREDAQLLAAGGVRRYETIANWRRSDIEMLGGGKALRERVASENWIEQAAMLAAGQSTAYATALEQHSATVQSPLQAITDAIAAAMADRETIRSAASTPVSASITSAPASRSGLAA